MFTSSAAIEHLFDLLIKINIVFRFFSARKFAANECAKMVNMFSKHNSLSCSSIVNAQLLSAVQIMR